MGFRFRKSFKVAPGVRLNVGKKSSSVSFGGKGFRTSVSTTGRRTHTTGIPGTGISYVSTSGGKKSNVKHKATSQQKQASRLLLKVCGVIMWIIGIIALLLTIVGFCTDGVIGIIFLIAAIPCIFIAWLLCASSKQPRNE